MSKDTKIELLKIAGLVIILALLIWGIVWMNMDEPSTITPNDDISQSEIEDNDENEDTENDEDVTNVDNNNENESDNNE